MLLQNATPGVEAVEDVNGGMRVAGLMVYSTDCVQDGASSNNREFGGSMSLQGTGIGRRSTRGDQYLICKVHAADIGDCHHEGRNERGPRVGV